MTKLIALTVVAPVALAGTVLVGTAHGDSRADEVPAAAGPKAAPTRGCTPLPLPDGPTPPKPNGDLLVQGLNGPVTKHEVASFKTFMATRKLPTSPQNNSLVYGAAGTDTEALGLVYSFTHDPALLDRMLQFTDRMLSLRNDPTTGRVLFTGKRELAWPTKAADAEDARYAGTENGDTVAHIAYAAQLILEAPCLWARRVPTGDPHGFGATYKARAEHYVRELDKTTEGYLLKHFVAPATGRYAYPSSAGWKALGPRYVGIAGKAIPWNQQEMLNGAFQRLAICHEILGDDPARVARYDRVVNTSARWFLSEVRRSTVGGLPVYNWSYVAGRVPAEDTGHAGYDILGMVRADERSTYQVSAAEVAPYANTVTNVMYKGPNRFAKRVDGGGETQNYLAATWLLLAKYNARVYTLAGQAAITSGRVKRTPYLHATTLLVKDGRNRGTYPR